MVGVLHSSRETQVVVTFRPENMELKQVSAKCVVYRGVGCDCPKLPVSIFQGDPSIEDIEYLVSLMAQLQLLLKLFVVTPVRYTIANTNLYVISLR